MKRFYDHEFNRQALEFGFHNIRYQYRCTWYSFAEPPGPLEQKTLYEVLSSNTLSLYKKDLPIGGPSGDTIVSAQGTCFLLDWDGMKYLITAGHVADVPRDLFARFPLKSGAGYNELKIQRLGWTFHHQYKDTGGDVDMAAVKLPPYDTSKFYVPFPQNALREDPVPPHSILILGFPLLSGSYSKTPRPVIRQGIVSLTAKETNFKNEFGRRVDGRCFFVDAETHGGNSGSPVISNFEIYCEQRDLVIRGMQIAIQNALGLAVCEPASRIRECLDEAALRKYDQSTQPSWVR